jgi:hypothetical protein
MNDFYVLVDLKKKMILCPVMDLPSNWANISGLNLMSDNKVGDLTWAGHSNLGWKRFSNKSMVEYTSTDEWVTASQLKFKSSIKEERKIRESQILSFKGNQFCLDDKTKNSILYKLLSIGENDTFVWKFINRSVEIDSKDFIDLHKFTSSYIQSCFDVEYQFTNLISLTKTFEDLFNLNLKLDWPGTTY